MSFWFHCPHCESRTLVDNQLEGSAGACANCGKRIVVKRPGSPTTRLRRATEEVAPSPRAIQAMIGLLIGGLLLAAAASWIGLTLVVPRLIPTPSGDRLQTAANMTRIGVALQAYHQFHGTLPPAYFTDEQGVPTHSWRAMILPYLGEEVLAAAYRWDEPWNGPNNAQLLSRMPALFASPSDIADPTEGTTSFLAITGPGTAFPEDASLPLHEITDPLEETLLVAESAESEVSWLEPTDLHVSRMSFQINREPRISIRSRDPGGPQVLLADGTVRRLRESVHPRVLQALTTVRGFEPIDWRLIEAP
jgi:DNA-directed RNA polymerase subunit RPC12/RpoP